METISSLPNLVGVPLLLVDEILNHRVVGIKSTLHHPLALKEFLLQIFEPGLLVSFLLGPLKIPDMKYPIQELHGLGMLNYSRQVRADDLLKELILGGA